MAALSNAQRQVLGMKMFNDTFFVPSVFFEFYHSKDDLPGNLRVLFAELHVATIRYRLDLNTWYVCFVSDNDHYYPQSSMEECFNAICIRLGVFNDLDRIAEFGEVPAMPLPDRSL